MEEDSKDSAFQNKQYINHDRWETSPINKAVSKNHLSKDETSLFSFGKPN